MFGQKIGAMQRMVEPVGLGIDIGIQIGKSPHLLGLPGHAFMRVECFSVEHQVVEIAAANTVAGVGQPEGEALLNKCLLAVRRYFVKINQ